MGGLTPHALGLHRALRVVDPLVRPLLDLLPARRLAAAVNVSDLRDAAKLRAHKMVFDYLDAGADDEITLRRNKDALSAVELHPRVLAGLSPPLDVSTRVFGRSLRLPFFPAPTAGSAMFHRDGERGVARAAAERGAMYCLSTMGTTSPRAVASALPRDHPKLFQLYVWRDRGLVRDLLAQAKESGFHALALTVDLTWYGNRERDLRNGFTVPPAYTWAQTVEAVKRPAWTWDFLANEEYAYAALDVAAEARARRKRAAERSPLQQSADERHLESESEPPLPTDRRAQVSFIRDAFDPSFDWDDAEWLCEEWGDRGPVALKGVMRPEDAARAVERGFDAVWVSNHGGRQLETAPATADVLPAIREALGGFDAWADAKDAEEEVWREYHASIERASERRREGAPERDDPERNDPERNEESNARRSYAAYAARASRAARDAAPSVATSRKTGAVVELVADSGVQRGTDILKLLALGADGVAIGKACLYGLCAGGEAGAGRAMDLLAAELERAMGLAGVGTVREARRANLGLARRREASARDFPDPGARGRGYGGGIF